ncbi:EamA family transporter [Rhizobiales bacterium]|nr:EamA family transporter [Hongsoonwoonella zoysiae]
MSPADFGLYGATVLVWGVSWYAVKLQAGPVSPEVSVFWRFVLAAFIMMSWARIKGARLAFPRFDHVRFAALGGFIFSTNFVLFYYGSHYVPSGLLSVVFSLTSIFNMLLGFAIFGQKISRRVLIGALLGFTGIALMFRPQIFAQGATGFDTGALTGLAFCIGGTLSFCFGNMVSAANQRAGISVLSANAWGMVYGATLLGIFAFLKGESFVIDWTPTYVGTLVYLAVFATIVAFACYLTLLGRIGSARAGYATVMFPVVALLVSTALEDFHWSADVLAGLAAVLAGNIFVLRSSRR